jgi:glutamyl-tRNA synthetase
MEKSIDDKFIKNEQSSLEQINKRDIVDLIFTEELPSVESILEKYPERNLPENAMVTRFAPSPTGFLHIGGVYMALISERFAHQTDGVYFVRMEDTDQKRKVDGAEDIINKGLEYFKLTPDEGPIAGGEKGNYGPYKQSERKDIYRVFLKKLAEEGKIYPCFSTEEELEEMRKLQSETSVRPGYYGIWAKWRDADHSEVLKKLKNGTQYVLRLKSPGDPTKKISVNDLIKGPIELPENDMDIIVMKTDGLPTYHFAHIVDDFLMKSTHIIRADEWISSIPIHFQLSDLLGFPRMEYGHIFPITKIDENGAKRKLSKRKDPEANVKYYQNKGYPSVSVIEYLMNLANSEFESWKKENPEKKYTDFKITFKRLSQSTGPIFDEVKLRDISKDIISEMSLEDFYNNIVEWASLYDQTFYKKIKDNEDYWTKVFAIERDSSKRKDISSWSEVYEFYKYFDIGSFFTPDWNNFSSPLTKDEIDRTLKVIAEELSKIKDANDFMNAMRSLAAEFGLAESIKDFKNSKGKYRGHVGLVSQVVRFAITGLLNTPDLFQIIRVLGIDETKRRLLM